jgi:VanZ family protein
MAPRLVDDSTHSRFVLDALVALLCSAMVACADEFRQTFLPNGTGALGDVHLDCTGVIVLQLAAYIVPRILKPDEFVLAT